LCKFDVSDDDLESACKYYYSDTEVINSEICECSLMEEYEPGTDMPEYEGLSKIPK